MKITISTKDFASFNLALHLEMNSGFLKRCGLEQVMFIYNEQMSVANLARGRAVITFSPPAHPCLLFCSRSTHSLLLLETLFKG